MPRDEPRSSAVTESLREALRAERTRNLRLLNRLRVVSLLGFEALLLLLTYGWHDASWAACLHVLGVYTAVSVLVWQVGERGLAVSRWSGLAVPLVDVPMIYWLQIINLRTLEQPGATSAFTVAFYVFLVMLASFPMDRVLIFATALMAAAFDLRLQSLEHTNIGVRLSAVLLLALSALTCSYASERVRRLVRHFSLEQLRREKLGRYFSPQVAAVLAGQHEVASESRDVTVLFSDVRDFTAMSESMTSEDVVDLLNAYFDPMVQTIFAHGGTLDKYIGDGLMAYFGAPIPQADHAQRAVSCALAMQQALLVFNQDQERLGRPILRMGIGVHSGPVILGELGSSQRREYTAIGDTVNLASRIEGLTKTHAMPVLVSEETRRRVGDQWQFEAAPPVQVKGKAQPVQTFSPR